MIQFRFVDESGGEFAAEQAFLEAWFPVVAEVMVARLGRTESPEVLVVLSRTSQHSRRFPARRREAETLSIDPLPQDNPGQISIIESYAHGVATRAAPRHRLPDVPNGAAVIFLDVPTIIDIASRLDRAVPVDSMLARVSSHELSHAIRGHAVEDDRCAHGWFREGEAQRDAFDSLTDLLVDVRWAWIARWARAAQVRLSSTQPSAYRMFGHDSPDAGRLLVTDPKDAATWALRPSWTSVVSLDGERLVELPVVRPRIDSSPPATGDVVYLGDEEIEAGPWVVVSVGDRPRGEGSRHRLNTRFDEEIVWFRLRPASGITAHPISGERVHAEGSLRVIEPPDRSRWRDYSEVADEVRRKLLAALRAQQRGSEPSPEKRGRLDGS